MLSSFDKNDWKEDRYKDYQEEKSNFLNIPNNPNLTNKLIQKAPKKELNLPKTKLTRKGQIYLYTNGLDDSKQTSKPYLNKNLLKKSYSKKWIDDITLQDFSLDPNKLLDENFEENLNNFLPTKTNISSKVGKNSEYFIHDLKIKSGRDRRLQKASYLEYLPSDFDFKNELADCINQINNPDRLSNSRQTENSGISLLKDVDDYNSSEDETFENLNSNQSEFSRLSTQPVLSAQSLINRLNFTPNTSYLIKAKPKNNPIEHVVTNPKVENETNVSINYKNTFNFDEVVEQNNKLNEPFNFNLSSARDEFLTRTKILEKRSDNRQNNTPINLTMTTVENSETVSLNNSKHNQNRKDSLLGNKQNRVNSSNWPKQPLSAQTKFSVSPKQDHLTIIGSKQIENEENLPNLYTRTHSFYNSFINNRNPTTPTPTYDKIINENNQELLKQKVYFRPPNSEEENLEPITISLTEIENETTGSTVKIRRFFDRQSMQIKQIPIKEEAKSNKKLFSKIGLRQMPQTLNNNINNISNQNQSENSTNKPISRRSSTKSNEVLNDQNEQENKPVKSVVIYKNTSSRRSSFSINPNVSIEAKKADDSIKQKIKENLEKLKKESNDLRIKSAPNKTKSSNSRRNSVFSNRRLSVKSLNEKLINLNKPENEQFLTKSSEKQNEFKNEEEEEETDQNLENLEIQNDENEEIINEENQNYEPELIDENQQELNKIQSLDTNNMEQNDFVEEEIEEDLVTPSFSSRRTSLNSYVDQNLEQEIQENNLLEQNFEIEKKISSPVSAKSSNSKSSIKTNKSINIESPKLSNENIESNMEKEIIETNNIQEEVVFEQIVEPLSEEKTELNLSNNNLEENINKIKTPEPIEPKIELETEIKNEKIETFDEIEAENDKQREVINDNRNVNEDVSQTNIEIIQEPKIVIEDNNTELEDKNSLEQNTPEEIQIVENLSNQAEVNEVDDNLLDKTEENDLLNEAVNSESNQPNLIETIQQEEKNEPIEQETSDIENVLKNSQESISIEKESNALIIEEKINENKLEQIESKQTFDSSSSKKEAEISIKGSELNLGQQNILQINKYESLDLPETNQLSKSNKKLEFSDKTAENLIIDKSENQNLKLNITKDTEHAINENNQKVKTLEIEHHEEMLNKLKKDANSLTNKINTNTKVLEKQSSSKTKSKSKSEPKVEKEIKKIEEPKVESLEELQKAEKNIIINSSKLNALLGIKEPDENKTQEVKPNFKEKLALLSKKKDKLRNFPFLTIPWDSKEPVVDYNAYKQAFQIPEILCPEIHQIDPNSTSVDELILERRILEDKILELRQAKLSILNMSSEERAKLHKKPEKKKPGKKLPKKDETNENDMKSKVLKEERLRLHNEALKKKLERENYESMMIQNIIDKEKELENLKIELENNTQDYNRRYNSLVEQIKYLEETEDQIREVLAQSRAELKEKIAKNQAEMRKSLRERHEERREQKMFDFNVKRKELEFLMNLYNDSEELNKIKTQLAELDFERDQWLSKFENDCMDQEKELDDKEEEEENRISMMEQEEEENSLKSIKQEQFELLQEKKSLIENFDDIKLKINNRIEKIIEEKKNIENEKKLFDESTIINIEKQKEKLVEILQAEHDAKETIKKDLEDYKDKLLKIRDKNLKMRCSLTYLNHIHNLSKPFVYSYVNHWPIEIFAKPLNQDKKKVVKTKK